MALAPVRRGSRGRRDHGVAKRLAQGTVGLYRANLAPRTLVELPPPLASPVTVPALGVWIAGTPPRRGANGRVEGRRDGALAVVRIEDGGHWIPLEAPQRFAALLLEHLDR